MMVISLGQSRSFECESNDNGASDHLFLIVYDRYNDGTIGIEWIELVKMKLKRLLARVQSQSKVKSPINFRGK
jgi:hypothetical protein